MNGNNINIKDRVFLNDATISNIRSETDTAGVRIAVNAMRKVRPEASPDDLAIGLMVVFGLLSWEAVKEVEEFMRNES